MSNNTERAWTCINRWRRRGYAGQVEIFEEVMADNERLRVQNIQMQAALGYAICTEDDRHIIPSNPYSCGVCDANKGVHDEIDRLRAALNADAQTLRLHLGEMTSQEMRTLKAGLKWVLSCAALEGK